jgi:drug/metabolite transporter (DMT)-like permease
MDPVEIGFWRAAIGGTCFVAHAAFLATRRRSRESARSRLRVPGPDGAMALRVVGLALVGVSLFYVALPKSIEAGGIGLAAILLYSAPVFVVLGSRVAFGHPLTARRVRPVVVTVVGVALVAATAGGEVEAPVAAVVWGLTAGAAYASYYLVGRTLVDRFGPVRTYALVMPIGALALVPLVPWSQDAGTDPGLLLGLGVVSTYLAYLAFATGLSRVDSTRASVVATIEPVLATAIGVVAYDEALVPLSVVGSALVVGAAMVAAAGDDDVERTV